MIIENDIKNLLTSYHNTTSTHPTLQPPVPILRQVSDITGKHLSSLRVLTGMISSHYLHLVI